MKNSLGVAELKAHLSEQLRRVRQGQSLTVLDRSTPIARITPVTGAVSAALAVRHPGRKGRLRGIAVLPPLADAELLAEALRDERTNDR